jgi:uncharacterized membrane protein
MPALRTAGLVAAALTTAMMAGLFSLYAHTVMPGLGATDDRTFIAAFQAIDRAIVNPWFLATGFLGALISTAVAAATHLGRPTAPWVLAALLLYLVAVVVTVAVHLPLNDAIKAAGDPHLVPDPAAIRHAFDEARWAAWNLVRTVATTSALGCLCWALVLHGRATA